MTEDEPLIMRTPILDKENNRIIYGRFNGKLVFRKPFDKRLYTDDGPTEYYIENGIDYEQLQSKT